MAEERSQMFKNAGKNQEECRKQRAETSIQLRREKRGNVLNKRRNIGSNDEYDSGMSIPDNDSSQFQHTFTDAFRILTTNPGIPDLQSVFTFIRKELSRANNPPIDEVFEEGLVPALVRGLAVDDSVVRFEAAWALTNVLAGESHYTQAAVECGAAQALIDATRNNDDDEDFAGQCIWGIANIVGDSAQLRDHAVNCGVLELLNHFVTTKLDEIEIGFIRNLAWICANLCRHNETPMSVENVAIIIPIIKKLLEIDDDAARYDTCWSLMKLIVKDQCDEILDAVVDTDILPCMVELLDNSQLVIPIMQILGSVASGNDAHTQAVVDLDILNDQIADILQDSNQKTIKEVLWMLSNILGGKTQQIDSVINAGLIPKILKLLSCGSFRVQNEAAWALDNLCNCGDFDQIYYLALKKAFKYLVPLLDNHYVDFVAKILSIIKRLFNAVGVVHPELLEDFKTSFEEMGGLDKIEEMQHHDNSKICELCVIILEIYFSDEEDEDDDDV